MNKLFSLSLAVALSFSAFASGGSGGGGGTGGGGGGTAFPGVSLSVSKETAAPGALAQMKVFITEPKPITTGGGSMTFSAYGSISGIALSSHAQDTYGVAVVRGNAISLSAISPSATFGDAIDYPLLTIVGTVPAGTPIGTKFPLNIDPNSMQLYDPSGALYPLEVKNGFLVAGNTVSVADVNPGSAIVPAGGVVTITGNNFVPGTNVKFAEASIARIIYVSPTRIDVVLGTTANMHGMMIKVSNPDGTSDVYFSYQRTRADSLSVDPVLQFAVPLVPPVSVTSANITLPAPSASTTFGVALQNIGAANANASISVLDASGNVLATAPLGVTVNHFVVRGLGELFGSAPAGAASVHVTSDVPVEVVGISADQIAGTAKPVLAQ